MGDVYTLMLKPIWLTMMVLAAVCIAYGQHHPNARPQPTIDLGAGFGREHLDWSIAGHPNGQNPNILSELAWDDLQGMNTWLRMETPVWRRMVVAADLSFMQTLSGHARDTDYSGDNRTNKVFDMPLKSDRGYRLTYGAMAGYRLFDGGRFSSIAYLGYRWRAQRLLLLYEADLESTYRADWRGPLVQLSVGYRHRHLAYRAAASYGQLRYRAVADWNLIDAFEHPRSFEHQAKGYFLGLNAQVWLFPYRRVHPALFMDYGITRSGRGIDYLYLADGEIQLTQFNGARGSSLSVGAGVTYSW